MDVLNRCSPFRSEPSHSHSQCSCGEPHCSSARSLQESQGHREEAMERMYQRKEKEGQPPTVGF
ncbi:hypothetical protein LB505_001646 [Fusarium chuoi]|nr:hypothetical protein LB505_001646 [Fusarium chuoi]